jgi:ribosome assembly protein 1
LLSTDEDPLYQIWSFDPDKGNLVFACAFDCWGLTTTKFANIYAKKYNVNMKVLKKYFFDDYVFNISTKKITKYDPTKNLSSSSSSCNNSSDDDFENYKPMFARFILDPIWHIYDVSINKQDAKAAASYAQSEVRYVVL